ncbi:hypothetical protein OF83DRAFT_1165029 [Amylostereum chailletii]|nr:hypothetical protein OF83DRAFT_1165029 [Amylostereum chailletii]
MVNIPEVEPHPLNIPDLPLPPFNACSITMPELYDWQAERNPDHPLFVYQGVQGKIHNISFATAVPAMHRAAFLIASRLSPNVVDDALKGTPAIIAIIAATDSITYLTTVVGILRAGFAAFLVSPRNSPEAIAHLLKDSGVCHLLIEGTPIVEQTAEEALQLLSADTTRIPCSRMPVFESLYAKEVLILHSSGMSIAHISKCIVDVVTFLGSTAFPNRITWTHEDYMTFGLSPRYGEMELGGTVMGCQGVPMYHGMGVFEIVLAAAYGTTLAMFIPTNPAVIPNPYNVADSMMIYSGGPLSSEVGNSLVSKGVPVSTLYACSEAGGLSTIFPRDGTSELYVMKHNQHTPMVLNTTIAGRRGYATSDILQPHPAKPGLWRVYGRKDDQIMLSTGEKAFKPTNIEAILVKDPHIKAAVMFGRGRSQNGVLIEPIPASAFDPTDEGKLVVFRNLIWPTVERMNEYAPQHSRLFKEMIVVTSPSKPFVYSGKMSPRRPTILEDYKHEIEAVYKKVDESSQGDIPVPTEWSLLQTMYFVRRSVAGVLKTSVGDDDDLFQHGCDSLQATWIRNSLLRGLRDTVPTIAGKMHPTFVYDHPTVDAMAAFIHAAVDNFNVDGTINAELRSKQLEAIVDDLTKDFPERGSMGKITATPDGDVFLVTGTTGTLGSRLLACLLKSKSVARIYAVNRPSGSGALERHEAAFAKGGLDLALLASSKLVLVEGNLATPHFGVTEDLYCAVTEQALAWPVNFNAPLKVYDESVRGVRKMVDFALESPHSRPPRILFTSSIGVFRNFDLKVAAKETAIQDAKVPAGGGYAESKWIAERILDIASERTAVRAVIVRLGQVCGDGDSVWNEKEWFPSMVKSAETLGCLPTTHGNVSWIPSGMAASALVEMVHGDELHVHLVHPRPVAFSNIIGIVAAELHVPVCSYSAWLNALDDHARKVTKSVEEHAFERNPALRLVDFFHAAGAREDGEPIGVPRLDAEKAKRVSELLGQCKEALGDEQVLQWVKGWKRAGVLS